MDLVAVRVVCRLRLDDARSCLLRRASWEGGERGGDGGGWDGMSDWGGKGKYEISK